ncbi:MAG: diguanylate cyclase [Chloroflexi bacterium]|nr:MAG: diguanylate cyclase [Chloroflexota bacterium]
MARLKKVSAPSFSAALERAATDGAGVSVLLVDLDNLMTLNEKAGREAGDKAIAAAARALTSFAKAERWAFGRIGGDEFALAAPGIPLETAFLRAEQVRTTVNAALRKAVPVRFAATATIGVANLPRDAKTTEQLMRKADLALYSAKEQGGNAVGLPPPEDMVLRSSYYSRAQLGRLRALGERLKKKEAVLLREALDDLLRKYERT